MRGPLSASPLLVLVSLLVSLPADAQEPPPPAKEPAAKKEAKVVESGLYEYRRKGKAFGSERYTVYETAEGTRLVRVSMAFNHVEVRGGGRLMLSGGKPVTYSFLIERPQGTASVEASFTETKARCAVKVKPKDAKEDRTLLDREVDLPADLAVIEEGILSLDGLALQRFDRARGGKQELKVLVPQLGALHTFAVEAKGTGEVTYGTKEKPRKVKALRLHVTYRGVEQDYWLDAGGRLLRCASPSAAGPVEIVRVSDADNLKDLLGKKDGGKR